MSFVPAPNIVQIEMRASRNGQRIENRVMVDALTAPTAGILQDMAVIAWNWWENTYAPLLSNQVNLVEVVATDMSSQNGAQYTYAPSTGVVGTLGGLALPNEVSLCVSLRSGSRGRSARGRFYALSVAANQLIDPNNVNPTVAGQFASALQTLIQAYLTASWKMVVVSYRANKAPRPGGPVYFILTSAVVVDTVVDSMRRRRPGIGQ